MNNVEDRADYIGRLDTAEHLLRVGLLSDIKAMAKIIAPVYKKNGRDVIDDLMLRFQMRVNPVDIVKEACNESN